MRKAMRLLATVSGIALVMSVGAAVAQSNPPAGDPNSSTSRAQSSITGTVVSTGSSSLAVRADDGREMTFTLDTGVTIPAGLKAGDRVTVNYISSGTGFKATSLTPASGSPTPPGATSSTTQSDTTYHSDTTATNPNRTDSTYQSDRTRTDTAYQSDRRGKNLPQTASPLPLLALLGTVMLGTGAILVFRSKRTA